MSPQAPATGNGSTSPTSPGAGTKDAKQIKADLKNESAYAKVLTQKSKAEGQELKAAIKDGQGATKVDAKVRSSWVSGPNGTRAERFDAPGGAAGAQGEEAARQGDQERIQCACLLASGVESR